MDSPDESGSTVSGVVAPDGSLTLNVYYARNLYTIEFYVDGILYDSIQPTTPWSRGRKTGEIRLYLPNWRAWFVDVTFPIICL